MWRARYHNVCRHRRSGRVCQHIFPAGRDALNLDSTDVVGSTQRNHNLRVDIWRLECPVHNIGDGLENGRQKMCSRNDLEGRQCQRKVNLELGKHCLIPLMRLRKYIQSLRCAPVTAGVETRRFGRRGRRRDERRAMTAHAQELRFQATWQ